MNELQKIDIKARPPANYSSEQESIDFILEFYNKGDYNTLQESCEASVKRFVKNLPSPILTDIDIYHLFYGAYAFNRIGESTKQIGCLKILYSLQGSNHLLNESAIELLNQGIAEYKSLAVKRGIDYLNSIEVEKIKFKGSGCFIATAIYGTPYASEVITLKEFRDKWLLTFILGKAFVKLYYIISPPIANLIAKHNYMKEITKSIIIIPLLKLAKNLKRKEN